MFTSLERQRTGGDMALRYRTPRELVEGLQRSGCGARAQMWQVLREPLERLMGELIARHGLDEDHELLTLHALHSAETALRTRPADAFAEMSWAAFRGAILLQMARIALQPFGPSTNGAPPGPSPLPESAVYQSETFFRPYGRVGNHFFGGDWYAGRQLADGSLWVFLADVTGHGYYAYLLASGLPGVWQRCWNAHPGDAPEPIELLSAMHDFLCECLPEGIFLECTLVRLAQNGTVTVVPAGGTRMFVRTDARPPALLKLRGDWLGLRAPSASEQHILSLGHGDELLLTTDGVFDQLDEGGEGVTLANPLRGTLLDAVRDLLEQSLAHEPQKDDMTMVLLRCAPEETGPGRSHSRERPPATGRTMFQCDCPPEDFAGRVKAYLAGDRAAGDAPARKFGPLVRAVVGRVLGPGRREEWDDACQTIFLRLFSNLHRWEQRCPFCKWLAVVAARRAIDLGRLPLTPGSCFVQRVPLEQIPDQRPATPDPETIERIEQAVARFPAEWRQVWEWWVQGERREEMARGRASRCAPSNTGWRRCSISCASRWESDRGSPRTAPDGGGNAKGAYCGGCGLPGTLLLRDHQARLAGRELLELDVRLAGVDWPG